jgi:hypothetical protein
MGRSSSAVAAYRQLDGIGQTFASCSCRITPSETGSLDPVHHSSPDQSIVQYIGDLPRPALSEYILGSALGPRPVPKRFKQACSITGAARWAAGRSIGTACSPVQASAHD